jgi:hypothetical protein
VMVWELVYCGNEREVVVVEERRERLKRNTWDRKGFTNEIIRDITC